MPFYKGGLGLRRVTIMNDSLFAKLLCRWHKDEGEWCDIWKDKCNRENQDLNHFLNNKTFQGGSMIWKHAQKNKKIIKKGVRWKVGNGRIVLFWDDI